MSSNDNHSPSSPTNTKTTPDAAADAAVPSWSSWLPPAPVWFVAVGVPCLIQAWRDYRAPILGGGTTDAAPRQAAAVAALDETVEESVRRAAASRIATRALRVATAGSLGVTCLVTAAGLTWAGYRSLGRALEDARRVGRNALGGRPLLEDDNAVTESLGLHPDRSHPDFAVTRNMTAEREMEYLAEQYFPGEDWTQPDGMARTTDASRQSTVTATEEKTDQSESGSSTPRQ